MCDEFEYHGVVHQIDLEDNERPFSYITEGEELWFYSQYDNAVVEIIK